MVEQVKTKSEPRVRFRGFTDEWEQVKLGELLSYEQPTKYIVDSDNYDDNFITPVLTAGKSFLLGYTDETDGVYDNGDVILFDDFTTATQLVDFKFKVKSSAMKLLTPTGDNNINFLYETLNRVHYPHDDHKRYWISEYATLNVKTPSSLDEQQKIGDLFQTLDKAIDLSNTQVENLKQQKKALLQRLFPQKGETEPKARLRGFTDAWEEVKLGDVFSVYSKKGRTDLPFVTVSERETNERTASAQGYGNDVSDNARAKAKVLLSGQFLIDLSSYSRGIYMSRMDGVTSSAYNVLNLDNGVGSYWVEYLISHDFVESLKRLTPPGARQGKMIEVDGLLKTKVHTPSLEEQQAIGELFQTVDEQIRLAEDKVSRYKELKQALLQRLFV